MQKQKRQHVEQIAMATNNETIQATIFNLELGEPSWRVSSFSQEYKRESFNHSSNEISLPKVFSVYFPILVSHPKALNPWPLSFPKSSHFLVILSLIQGPHNKHSTPEP